MSEHSEPQASAPTAPEAVRPQDSIESFVTSKGSVYTYDEDGHTTRFKTKRGEEQPQQGITVFIDLNAKDFGTIAAGYLLKSSTEGSRVEVAELGEDGQPIIVTDIKDVTRPDKLILATFKNGSVAKTKPASLMPKVGTYVFDSRQFQENGQPRTERHLGHKVTEIRYRDDYLLAETA